MGQMALRRAGSCDCINMYTGPIGPNRFVNNFQDRWYKIQDGPNSLQKDWLLGLYKNVYKPNWPR